MLHSLLARGQDATLAWAGRWELAFWALVLLLTAALARLRPAWVGKAEDALVRISQHRSACAWGVAACVIVLRTLLLPLVPVPIPVILDEYSYLLGADTFAAGRITNPPHPMWGHFESFNINMQPTYQSMYPPAQALVLGLAQRLTGVPWLGVLLSVAVMCGVFTWMLQGWMPPQWALLGGLYSVLRYGIFSYWINSYWGGAVAAIGGALLLGSLPRLRRALSGPQALVFTAGLVILANSRPFEGLLFAAPMLAAISMRIVRDFRGRSTGAPAWPGESRRILMRIVAPCVLLLTVAATAMLYYNWRGTGHALQMPYVLNQDTYHISRPFYFQKPYPIPHYRNVQMRTFYMFHEYPDLLRSRTSWGLQVLMEQKFFCYYVFLLWPLLLLFVPGVMLAAARPELRVVVVATALMMAGLTLQLWPAHGHYAAPAAGAVLLILLNALRKLREGVAYRSEGGPHLPSVGKCGGQQTPPAPPSPPSLRLRWEGRIPILAKLFDPLWLSRAIILALLLTLLLPIADRLWNPYALDELGAAVPKQIDRERIQSQLNRTPGEHLVIVHYQQRDVPSVEWVYNRADIDHAKVVWARDMGPEANRELLRYFGNRRVWYVDRNNGAILEPYTIATASGVCHPGNGLPPDCQMLAKTGLAGPPHP